MRRERETHPDVRRVIGELRSGNEGCRNCFGSFSLDRLEPKRQHAATAAREDFLRECVGGVARETGV